jgi:hypothetical protein
LKKQLSESAFSDCRHGTVVRLEDIVQNHPLSNDDYIIREIHILKSYYKLSRKRFVGNVRMQAADFYLLTGPETPLKLFSSKFVAGLTTAKLRRNCWRRAWNEAEESQGGEGNRASRRRDADSSIVTKTETCAYTNVQNPQDSIDHMNYIISLPPTLRLSPRSGLQV